MTTRLKLAPFVDPFRDPEHVAAKMLHGDRFTLTSRLPLRVGRGGVRRKKPVLTEVSRAPVVGSEGLITLAGAFEAVLAVGLLDLVPEDVEPPPRELLIAAGEVDRLLDEREDARRRGDFGVADEIREMLERLGIEVRDTAYGTVWRIRAAVTARDADDDRA
jgi:hypothetical protein